MVIRRLQIDGTGSGSVSVRPMKEKRCFQRDVNGLSFLVAVESVFLPFPINPVSGPVRVVARTRTVGDRGRDRKVEVSEVHSLRSRSGRSLGRRTEGKLRAPRVLVFVRRHRSRGPRGAYRRGTREKGIGGRTGLGDVPLRPPPGLDGLRVPCPVSVSPRLPPRSRLPFLSVVTFRTRVRVLVDTPCPPQGPPTSSFSHPSLFVSRTGTGKGLRGEHPKSSAPLSTPPGHSFSSFKFSLISPPPLSGQDFVLLTQSQPLLLRLNIRRRTTASG